jgi:hypothetical protein
MQHMTCADAVCCGCRRSVGHQRLHCCVVVEAAVTPSEGCSWWLAANWACHDVVALGKQHSMAWGRARCGLTWTTAAAAHAACSRCCAAGAAGGIRRCTAAGAARPYPI